MAHAIVAISGGGYEAAVYDKTGHIDSWKFSGAKWAEVGRSSYQSCRPHQPRSAASSAVSSRGRRRHLRRNGHLHRGQHRFSPLRLAKGRGGWGTIAWEPGNVLVLMGNGLMDNYTPWDIMQAGLRVNPRYAPAQVLLADLNISDERFDDAKAAAEKAVAENPRDEDALARLAASCRLLVDPVGAAAAEAGRAGEQPPARDLLRRARRAAGRPPQVSRRRTRLPAGRRRRSRPRRRPDRPGHALHADRPRDRGQEPLRRRLRRRPVQRPRRQHDEGAQAHGQSYTPVESPSTSASWSTRPRTSCWASTWSRYLESIYAELTGRFGYAPPGKTKIEIMKNHQWFSGRTIGLPFVPTVGACTGKVVALASPRTTRRPFNWARVLKHEVVHVITLQQTEFNIPHWYTEALAVESEGFPGPRSGTRCSWNACPTRAQALEPRHDQPRLHPSQRARRPPDGLLPGPALRPVHAQAVRRRRPDQDARWPTAAA